MLLVHDFAYSDTAFDGFRPPSILEVPGASEVAVELYTLTKSFSMAGWRVAFLVGNAEIVQGLTKLKSYLDYGTFQPIQIAAIVAMNEAPDYPKLVNEIYQGRRDALCDGLARIGWEVPKPKGTMFVWAKIPEPVPSRWARSSSPSSSSERRRWRRRRERASVLAARAMFASPSSRTSSGSRRRIRNLRDGAQGDREASMSADRTRRVRACSENRPTSRPCSTSRSPPAVT